MNLWWALIVETSLFFNGGIIQYESFDTVILKEPITTMIQAEIGRDNFVLYGAVSVDMWMQEFTSYLPFNNQYTVGGIVTIGAVEIGLEHSCYHPMVPYMWIPSRRQIVPSFEGAFDRVYVKIRLEGGARR